MNFTDFDRLQTLTGGATGNDFCATTAAGDSIALSVTTYGAGIFRLRLNPIAKPDYGLIVASCDANSDFKIEPNRCSVSAGKARLTLASSDRSAMKLALTYRGKTLLTSIEDEQFRGMAKPLEAERIAAFGLTEKRAVMSLALDTETAVYGLGEKGAALNKRGQLVSSRVEDALGVSTDLAYKNTPFAWAITPNGCWGVLTHTTVDVQHGVGHAQWSNRSYVVVTDEPQLDVFFIAADTPTQLIAAYHRLTGKPENVPLWSLGAWISRAYYKDEADIMATAQELRDRKFPADVITFDGRAWQDTPTRFHFNFDPSRYPDPKRVIDNLKALDYKICCWEYPLVSVNHPQYSQYCEQNYFLKNSDGSELVFHWDTGKKTTPFGPTLTPLPPSGLVDFTNPAAYAWWRDEHKKLWEVGVDTIKSDFGEQVPTNALAFNGDTGDRVHNVNSHLYNRCVYEASVEAYGDQACLWGRAGWIGTQRHPLQWGGDPQSDWGGFANSLRAGLNHGHSGSPFHATDVGGFYGANQPEPALYLRWVQAAIFSSHFRIHGIGAREPWAFGKQVETIAREFFEIRYKLLPYLRGACDLAVSSGLPVMRSMALMHPDDRVARSFEMQFYCGPHMIVMPVLNREGDVEGYLPDTPGGWYDLWSGMHVDGGEVITLNYDLERIPVFVRAGVALAIGPVVQSTVPLEGDTPVIAVAEFGAKPKNGYEICVRGKALTRDNSGWRSYGQSIRNVRRFL
ncbi:MAG: alpha-xylosidase [Betaproteobacteria bacterium]|nr:MAG: alpha-xylosidase [Betaproteobacteria bacterium]